MSSLPSIAQSGPAFENSCTMQSVMDEIDLGTFQTPPAQTLDTLEAVLNNPFTLNGMDIEQHYTLRFLTKLGLACQMSEFVLPLIFNSTSLDPGLAKDLQTCGGTSIVRDLVSAQPKLFETITPARKKVLWDIIGYHPNADSHAHVGLIFAMEALQPAEFVPEEVINQARQNRNSALASQLNSPEHNDRHATQEQKELELIVSKIRVVFGVFVAERSGDPVDIAIMEQAGADFLARMTNDTTSLELALDTIIQLDAFTSGENAESNKLQKLIKQSVVQMTTDIDPRALFAADALNIAEKLTEFEERFGERAETAMCITRAKKAVRADHETAELLAEEDLDHWENTENATVYSVIKSLREGYTPEAIERAVGLSAYELDPARKARTIDRLNTAIKKSLANLPEDNAMCGENALEFLNSDDMHVPLLTRFSAGQEFVAQKTSEYVLNTFNHLGDFMYLIQNSVSSQHVSVWLRNIHDAVWCNRDYYAAATETAYLNQTIADICTRANDLAASNTDPEISAAINDTIAGLDAFMIQMAEQYTSVPTRAPKLPLQTILDFIQSTSK